MLTRLRLSRFRCYGSLDWEIPAEGAVLVGGNAQGKTSLLEAICLALTLHSPAPRAWTAWPGTGGQLRHFTGGT